MQCKTQFTRTPVHTRSSRLHNVFTAVLLIDARSVHYALAYAFNTTVFICINNAYVRAYKIIFAVLDRRRKQLYIKWLQFLSIIL